MFIYLFCAEINNKIQYKIGVSNNPEKRFKTAQTSNPNLINIVSTYRAVDRLMAFKVESVLHKKYYTHNIGGEWFEMDNISANHFLNECNTIENNIKITKL